MVEAHSLFILAGLLSGIAGLSLAFLSQRYWFARAWKFAGRIKDRSWRRGARGGLLGVLGLIALAALSLITRSLRGPSARIPWWPPFIGLWLFSSIFSYLFIKIIAFAEWAWKRILPENNDDEAAAPALLSATTGAQLALAGAGAHGEHIDHSRRHFFQAAGVIAGAVPFATALYGFSAERFRYDVRHVEIPVANLPRALDGLRIAQLSDIHIGSYMPVREVRRAVGMANELGGDIAVVTGDFLTGRSDPLEACIAELSKLRAPLGIWGCNGNHEAYAGAEAESALLFHKFGMKLLRQENVELRWNSASFNLIGVDYQRQRDEAGRPLLMLSNLDPLVRRDVPNILLSHNPNSFRRAAELGVELSLAGHTHGGQVRVEILDHRFSPAEFLTPYVAGLYERPLHSPSTLDERHLAAVRPSLSPDTPASKIYVNRGLGTIGAPIRLGVPPEITLITLRAS